MIALPQIIDVAKDTHNPDLPLELRTNEIPSSVGGIHAQEICTPNLTGWAASTASFFRRLLRLHTERQREAANLFITAMHQAHPDSVAIEHILSSEKIRRHKPVTAKQVLRAYQKFVLLEQTSYQFVDDGTGTNHKELRFMHGLVLKLKTFFR